MNEAKGPLIYIGSNRPELNLRLQKLYAVSSRSTQFYSLITSIYPPLPPLFNIYIPLRLYNFVQTLRSPPL